MFDFDELEISENSILNDDDDSDHLDLNMMSPPDLADSDDEDADTLDGHRKRAHLAKLREEREKELDRLYKLRKAKREIAAGIIPGTVKKQVLRLRRVDGRPMVAAFFADKCDRFIREPIEETVEAVELSTPVRCGSTGATS